MISAIKGIAYFCVSFLFYEMNDYLMRTIINIYQWSAYYIHFFYSYFLCDLCFRASCRDSMSDIIEIHG
jgi:hypothetical protein